MPVKHGGVLNGKRTPEYTAWCEMRARCAATTGRRWKYYGSRGIKVHESWDSFEVFLAHVGPKPGKGYSLDRIDNNKGYEPGNVRWLTQPEQIKNSRRAHKITFGEETLCVTEWAAKIGIDYTALIRRIEKWGIQKALTTPVNTKFRNSNAGKKAQV